MNYSQNANNIEFIKRQIETVTKAMRVHINRIIGLASMLETLEESEIAEELKLTSYKLLAQNMNMSYLYSEDLPGDTDTAINAAEYVGGIVGECDDMINVTGCKLKLEVKCSKTGVKIKEKAFIMAVINLLQNALLYSPPKTEVTVSVENETRKTVGYVSVAVKNVIEKKRERDAESSAKLGLVLCMKIAEYYGGFFECEEVNDSITSKLLLPLETEEPGLGLSSDIAEYIADRYNPVKLFMQEVVNAKKQP